MMQSDANQCNAKFYNESNSSGTDCNEASWYLLYSEWCCAFVVSNSISDSLDINTSSNIYNFGSGLYLFGGPRALEFVFYHRLNGLSGML